MGLGLIPGLGLAGFAAGPAAAKAAADTISARVAEGSQTDPTGSWFSLNATAGASIEQSVVVRNPNSRAVTVRVEGVDGFTSDTASASYGTPGSVPERSGRWIAVSTPELIIDAGAEQTVPFSVRVPANTAPGEYLAGLSVSVPPNEGVASTPGGGGAEIKLALQAQRLIAVKVTVPGPASANLVVSGTEPFAGIDGVGLLIGLENQGNAFASGSAEVTIDGKVVHDFEISTFVPGTKIRYRAPWSRDIPDGSHAVAVRIDYADGRTTNWNGTVDIDDDAYDRLAADLANKRSPADSLPDAPASAPSEGGGLPFGPIALALAVGAVLTGATLAVRRSSPRRPARA